MQFLVLGSAAGGGLPQWNCLCENCRLAYARDGKIAQRSQCSVAVSADGENWVVLSATPDLRQQIIDNPELHPKVAPRHSPIKGVFAPNGDVDNIAGLLVMREVQPFTLWATKSVMAQYDRRRLRRTEPGGCQARDGSVEQVRRHRSRLYADPFRDARKNPALSGIANEAEIELGAESDATVGVEIREGDQRFYYMPSCARMTDAVRKSLRGADLIFFDGTTFEDDEMIRLGSGAENRLAHGPYGDEWRTAESISFARRPRDQAARFRPYQQFQSGACATIRRSARRSKPPAGKSAMMACASMRRRAGRDPRKPDARSRAPICCAA